MFNPEGRGLRKILRAREEDLLRVLWQGPASTAALAAATGLVRDDVLRTLGELHEQGITDVRDDHTMGNRREVWSAVVDEAGLRRMTVRRLIQALLEDWPEAADVIVEELGDQPGGR